MPDEVTTTRKTTTRKRTTKTTTRKAPTRAEAVAEPRRRGYAPLIAVVVFVVLVGGSAAIGFTDSGQINVMDTITDRKTNGTPEEQAQIQNIPVQQTRPTQPLGGLVPSANKPEPTPEPQVESASTTATSSDETEGGAEEGGDDEAVSNEESASDTPADTADTAATESAPAETVAPESTEAPAAASEAPAQ